MPRSGRMVVEPFAARTAREIHGFKTEAWTLKGAQVLNILYEIDNDTVDDLIPVTMRPAIPAYAIFNVTRYPESPAGPFTIAEVRVGSRAGVRPRGFVLRSYVNTEAAASELAQRWGYPAVAGKSTCAPTMIASSPMSPPRRQEGAGPGDDRPRLHLRQRCPVHLEHASGA